MTSISTSDGAAALVRHSDFPSQHVAPRNVDVWVPADGSGSRAFPVLYVQDGQNLFDPALSRSGVDWGLDEAMLRVMDETGSAGAILVGIWNMEGRVREYAPQQPLESLQGTPSWEKFLDSAGGAPESDGYLRFLVEELKPMIDTTYPTLVNREHTFIMGSSMGGLISLCALEKYPNVFGAAACISTHWPIGGHALVDAMAAALPRAGKHRLYFDYGTETTDESYEPFQRRMDKYLREAGYRNGKDWLTQKFVGAEHSERSWRQRVHIPLRFLLDQ